MEERSAPCSVLLVGENPSDTELLQNALREVAPDSQVSTARHHQDAARLLSACGQSTFRVAFLIPHTQEDAEILTIVRSSPSGGNARLIVLLPERLVNHTKGFYKRGAHSVVLWPEETTQRESLAARLAYYWEVTNLPLVENALEDVSRQPSVSVF